MAISGFGFAASGLASTSSTDTISDAFRSMAKALTSANVEADRAERILTDAAKATPGEFKRLKDLVAEITGGDSIEAPTQPNGPTFESVARDWVSGDLTRHPDHIRVKRSADRDEDRLNALYDLIGSIPLDRFTLADADRAMAALPARAKTATTRRHYAQLIARVLRLSVYPLKIRDASPIPPGWVPKPAGRKAMSYLHPSEDRALLVWNAAKASAEGKPGTEIPRERRLLWGLLAREGMRISEAARPALA